MPAGGLDSSRGGNCQRYSLHRRRHRGMRNISSRNMLEAEEHHKGDRCEGCHTTTAHNGAQGARRLVSPRHHQRLAGKERKDHERREVTLDTVTQDARSTRPPVFVAGAGGAPPGERECMRAWRRSRRTHPHGWRGQSHHSREDGNDGCVSRWNRAARLPTLRRPQVPTTR